MFLSGKKLADNPESVRDYPVVLKYKYLGVLFNYSLSLSEYLITIGNRLAKYKKMALILRL